MGTPLAAAVGHTHGQSEDVQSIVQAGRAGAVRASSSTGLVISPTHPPEPVPSHPIPCRLCCRFFFLVVSRQASRYDRDIYTSGYTLVLATSTVPLLPVPVSGIRTHWNNGSPLTSDPYRHSPFRWSSFRLKVRAHKERPVGTSAPPKQPTHPALARFNRRSIGGERAA